MIIGIYTILNTLTSKIYVGYSTNVKSRLCTHKRKLLNNAHPNIYLQSSWNKYGKENFKFELLVECEEQFLCSEEHHWCNMLNSTNRKYGYNIDATHPHKIRAKRSKETKQKLRNANLGKTLSIESRLKVSIASRNRTWSSEQRLKYSLYRKGKNMGGDKRIPIVQYSLSGEFIKEWKSAKEASIGLKIKMASDISKVCRANAGISTTKRNKRKSAGGFIWKYKENYNGEVLKPR